jgi:hypothetical protein
VTKPDTPRTSPVVPYERPRTPEQQAYYEWVTIRNLWIQSAFTGVRDGKPLPSLGPKP